MSKYAILATSGGVWPRMAKSALLVLNIANFGPDLAQNVTLGCIWRGVKMVILAILGQIWSFKRPWPWGLDGPEGEVRIGRGNHQIDPSL